MARNWSIVAHWTGGGPTASDLDRDHYHEIIEASGRAVMGKYTPEDNRIVTDGIYGAHTRWFNTKTIGISCAAMLDAQESPLDFGPYPINQMQFEKMCERIAANCEMYGIPVNANRVLTHAEVEPNLGIKQRGKWDIAYLEFRPDLMGARAVGDYMRERVSSYLGSVGSPLALPKDIPMNVRTLRQGDRGAAVSRLQEDLRTMRYFAGKTDGIFGRITRNSVMAFQADNDLVVDGIAGPRTLTTLSTIAAPAPVRDVTKADLIAQGSATMGLTSDLKKVAAGGGVLGVVGTASDAVAAADGLLPTLTRIVTENWPALLLCIGALAVWYIARRVEANRIKDAQTGAHLGK